MKVTIAGTFSRRKQCGRFSEYKLAMFEPTNISNMKTQVTVENTCMNGMIQLGLNLVKKLCEEAWV